MKERNVVTAVILSILTCGIYGVFWMYSLTEDMGKLTRDESFSGAKAIIFSILTCGIYGFYWHYKMGHQVPLLRSDAEDQGLLYLILSLVSLGIISFVLMQLEINKTLQRNSYQEVMTTDDFEF